MSEKTLRCYLQKCAQDIPNFKSKVMVGGYLRCATLSHLRRLCDSFCVEESRKGKVANKILNKFISSTK